MDLGVTIVALAGIVAVFGIPLLAIWTKHQKDVRGGTGPEIHRLNAIIADMHADMGKLKDRVSVLERLVTSEDRRIAEEIDRLSRSPGAGA